MPPLIAGYTVTPALLVGSPWLLACWLGTVTPSDEVIFIYVVLYPWCVTCCNMRHPGKLTWPSCVAETLPIVWILWKKNLMYLSNVYENSRWENHGTSVIVGIHDRIWMNTVDGRNIQTLSIRYNRLWGALPPMDDRNQPPNITFANMCAETLRFGGAGVQQSVCCRVWIFSPSTVSLSDVFTSLGVSWYPNFYCVNTLLHAADLIPNCAKHYLFTGQCNLSVFRPIFSFPWCATVANCTRHYLLTSKCNLCICGPIFYIPYACQNAKHIAFWKV